MYQVTVNTAKSEIVFNMTRFNYGIDTNEINEATEELVFNCEKDYNKFMQLYNSAYVTALYNNIPEELAYMQHGKEIFG